MPHNYPRNSVVYTGTHDNDTTLHWFQTVQPETRKFLEDYIGRATESDVVGKLIRLAMMSVADISIIPMQDILGLGGEARMNYPSRALGNWKWRMKKGEFGQEQIKRLRTETEIYGRAGNGC